MKTRNDFVTNSSSSSYVIAYKSFPEFDEETIAKYPFLKNYGNLIEKVLFTEGEETTAGKVFKTKEEWDKYFIDMYGWRNADTIEKVLEDDKCLADNYNKVIKHLEKGFNILDKRVDHNDSYCSNMLRELAEDKENFVILESE